MADYPIGEEDFEQEQVLRRIFYKMFSELPYDIDANELIANAVIYHLREHPAQIPEFDEIVSSFEPQFRPDWYTPPDE